MLTTRHFKHRYIPAQQKDGRERVLIVLHGLGDSLRGYSFLPEALKIPELSYLLLNAPDPYYGGYSWFDYQGNSVPGILRSRVLLFNLLDELKGWDVAARDIYLFGFSQGCLMATDLGLLCAEALGGICGVSGYVAFMEEYPGHFSPVAKKQHFLITHGARDPLLSFESTARQFQRLGKMGLDIDFRAYDKEHEILTEEMDDIAAWFRGRL
jgi:phospholipase/carboxylesterase